MTRRTTAPTTASTQRALHDGLGTGLLLAVIVALGHAPLAALAQPSTPAPTPAAVTALAKPDPHSPARVNTRHEPAVQERVLEDEHIIIEELLVRGQPVRISVRGKTAGARGYEVNVGPGGRDASQESGRAGQSAWRLFSF